METMVCARTFYVTKACHCSTACTLSYFFLHIQWNEHTIIDGHSTKKLLLLFEFAAYCNKAIQIMTKQHSDGETSIRKIFKSNKMHMAVCVNKTYPLDQPAVSENHSRSVNLTIHWLSINVLARYYRIRMLKWLQQKKKLLNGCEEVKGCVYFVGFV